MELRQPRLALMGDQVVDWVAVEICLRQQWSSERLNQVAVRAVEALVDIRPAPTMIVVAGEELGAMKRPQVAPVEMVAVAGKVSSLQEVQVAKPPDLQREATEGEGAAVASSPWVVPGARMARVIVQDTADHQCHLLGIRSSQHDSCTSVRHSTDIQKGQRKMP